MSEASYRRGGRRYRTLENPICWLGMFGVMEHGDPMPVCDGRLVRCHLIPKPLLRRAQGKIWDRRAWVWGCGGPTGIAGHHGLLDSSRTLRLPRSSLPPGLEELAVELELGFYLDRTYGLRELAA